MTHDLDLGIRFIVEPAGTVLSSEESAILADLRPAGIMLRKRNLRQSSSYDTWLPVYAKLIEDTREAIGRPSIIVCVDHEGGNVNRFPAPITRFPYPALYASSEEAISSVSAMMATELQSVGVNLSFSPVADIHSNPSNPVINERAFGTTAATVARCATLCAQALRAHGITPCAKHFPGHGDTATDSHYSLPVVPYSETQLLERELVPFKALIRDGIEMIMSAHLMVPQVDPNNQATLSPRIMRDLLREKLGFSGITIADALGMKAIHDAISDAAFAKRIHEAGIDLLLMVGDTVSMQDALALRNEFQRAVEDRTLDTASLGHTETRLKAFLNNLPQYPVQRLAPEVLMRHADLATQLSNNAAWSTFHFNPVGFD